MVSRAEEVKWSAARRAPLFSSRRDTHAETQGAGGRLFAAVMLLLVFACRDPQPPAAADVPVPVAPAVTATQPPAVLEKRSDPLRVTAPYGVEWTEAGDCRFTAGETSYTVTSAGRFSGTGRPLRLEMRGERKIKALQVLPYGDSLVLLYSVGTGDEEGGVDLLAVIDDSGTLSTVDVPGYNVGPPVIEGSLLYLSASGFAAAFNLDTWRWRWMHGDMGALRIFGFDPPVVYEREVVFRERPGSAPHAPREVVVDRETGGMQVRQGSK